MREWNNEELIRLYKLGDEAAFNEFYEKNQPLLKDLLRKYKHYHSVDAELKWEILNESIAIAISTFDEERGYTFFALLEKVFYNELNRELKRCNREKRKPKNANVHTMYGENGTCIIDLYLHHEDKYFKGELVSYNLINKALEKCNEKHRPYILPILLGKRTYEEVCEILNTSRQNVYDSVKRFKVIMRIQYSDMTL